jgi:hypothetical protein
LLKTNDLTVTAQRHGWLQFIPDLSPLFHRAWFSPEEYDQLYKATRKRAENPPKARWKWQCEQLHAKNCRTSVEMIEKFYAAHIKNMIDAAAVNVRRAAIPAASQERPNGRSPKGAANAKRPRIRRK